MLPSLAGDRKKRILPQWIAGVSNSRCLPSFWVADKSSILSLP